MRTLRPLHHRQGSSLIEILVVIVIFTIGILAIVQVFPTGLGTLRTTRNNTTATNLARAQMEAMKSDIEQLPEAILPANYTRAGAQWVIDVDLNRLPNDGTPFGNGLTNAGVLTSPDGDYGYWPQFSGANVMRRIVGEGKTIPSPRFVQTGAGALYGGVMTLQFGPVLIDPNFATTFIVYGSDLFKRWTDDINNVAGTRLRQDYVAYIDDEGTGLTLPQGPTRPGNPTAERQFRITASVRYDDGTGNVTRRNFIGALVNVPQAAGQRINYYIDLSTLFASPGLTFINVEPDTLRVQRVFEQTTSFITEAQMSVDPSLRDDAAYQYQMLDAGLGSILFNPASSTYKEQRGRGRYPMTARVDYDVLDWRNIRDNFRVPNGMPYQQKLIMDSLKVAGLRGPDQLIYRGIDIDVPNGSGGTQRQDFILFDQESGAIFLPASYRLDKSKGLLTFVDVDGNAANGLTSSVVYPGATTSATLLDIRGRSVRAIYQANNEFSILPMKATSEYRTTNSSTLGYGQCYIGGSNINIGADDPRRIYFPKSDVGKKVVVGEIWFDDGSGIAQVLREQEFRIQAPTGADWPALAYIDIRDKAPTALSFNYSQGFAVRRVRGASVGVRVSWNPTSIYLTNDNAENLSRLGGWLSNSRTSSTETFLMRGELQ